MLNFPGIWKPLITSGDKLIFYDFFGEFQPPRIGLRYFPLEFSLFCLYFSVFYLCSTCVHLCSTCVLLVFTCVHLCSLVFTCVHLCSLVFICVHLCSFVWCFRPDPINQMANETWQADSFYYFLQNVQF